ncbi:2-hydroxyacyl-CoA dehydratase family protein [Amycolatopsis jiangsuensis]|uniref:Benzoyl-CoA reductase/2-hydroxyglutaryl-CoA dehydratase subunit BcrC/BadD/HgdB n=1 Tax=Amycolatopsis jiangsuensis TaxID=1181879 RepID=A0A840IPM7_9PSEU|nr:2-hydroxyacyl-CoA dehydratase family protein [Amycolatopsis jiangsuensis]MBB4683128.1 benzoyl-CoA reductase/2-hydroxyglutaryl-CoA dehydratase subunit BcrC/BadD/HgdB [Amycolatopsis jiangsuensis]
MSLAALTAPAPPPARPVAGYVGADVPVELLTAAGLHPVRLAGSPREDAAEGRRYLGGGLDPVACSVLTRLLNGGYGPLDVLVVSRDCEASLRLFYVLRELRRVEPSIALPPVHLVDVLHLPYRTTTKYVLAKVRQFRGWLAGQGHPVTDAALGEAVSTHDRIRGLLRGLGEFRARRVLSGTEMLGVVSAVNTRPAAEVVPLLGNLRHELSGRSALPGRPVYLTGSSHDSPEVYEAVEAEGLLIVGEDHDRGDLLALGDVGAPTEQALAERYQFAGPAAARASIAARAAHTASAVREREAELLISYVRRFDDAPPWDFPAQRRAAGVSAVLVDRQSYGKIELDRLPLAVAR